LNLNLYRLDPTFWRFSLRRFIDFPFLKFTSQQQLNDFVRSTLKESAEISYWLDRLAHRPKGYYYELACRADTSDTKRALSYASKLLISTVIRNDTGVRGGISTVLYKEEFPNCTAKTNILRSSLPQNVQIFDVINREFSSIIDIRKSTSHFIIPIDKRLRFSVSSSDWQYIDKICFLLFKYALKSSKDYALSKCDIFIFAVDFLKNNGHLVPFEFHFPGRGVGMHFLSVMQCGPQKRSLINKTIFDVASEVEFVRGPTTILPAVKPIDTDFHHLDILFLEIINKMSLMNPSADSPSSNSRSYCAIENSSQLNNWTKRIIPSNIEQITSIIIKDKNEINDITISKIIEQFGPWVVIKQYRNMPWWHKDRLRPDFILLTSKVAKFALNKMIKLGPIQVQPIITSSLDFFGHFGELRIYCIGISQ